MIPSAVHVRELEVRERRIQQLEAELDARVNTVSTLADELVKARRLIRHMSAERIAWRAADSRR